MKKIINDKKEFFLPNNLYINIDILDKNFYFYKETIDDINKFTHDDAINDWLPEKVRIFNSSTFYLVHSIEKMIVFWNNREKGITMEAYLRTELRNTCINIEMYIDKIKSLIGYYFFLNRKTISDGKDFIKTISQFQTMDKILGKFIKDCKDLNENEKYKWIKSIRIAEIHNESLIDMHNYELSPDLIPIDKGYKINSETIIDNILYVLKLLYEIKNDVQKILETIPSHIVYKYIKENETNLKNILIPGTRADFNKEIVSNPT